MKVYKRMTAFMVALLMTMLPQIAMCQDTPASDSPIGIAGITSYEIVLMMLLAISVLLLFAVILLYYTMSVMFADMLKDKGEAVVTESFWQRTFRNLTDSVPLEQEETIATAHEYDGIRELDNNLPPWWLYGFYTTIAFAVVYLSWFYFFDMPSQDEEFVTEMKVSKEKVQTYLASLDNLIDESNVTVALDDADLGAGQEIFESKCAVCHAKDGGGGVGPNLTDVYWLHGGDIKDVFKTIKYGVVSKGMIAWETQLSPKKIQQVASYVYELQGKPTAKPKEPQGEPFERPESN